MSSQLPMASSAGAIDPKYGFKLLVLCACLAVVSPLLLACWLEKRLTRGEIVFVSLAQFLALIPVLPGAYLRAAFYHGTLDQCSWEVHVGFGSHFTHRGARIGRRASMGSYCVMGHVELGEHAMVGSRVSIPSGKRQHLDGAGRLSSSAPTQFDTVVIGPHCWIGEGAIILADVGERCIVAAGAVVTHAVAPNSLVSGNPARVVRELSSGSAEPGGG